MSLCGSTSVYTDVVDPCLWLCIRILMNAGTSVQGKATHPDEPCMDRDRREDRQRERAS